MTCNTAGSLTSSEFCSAIGNHNVAVVPFPTPIPEFEQSAELDRKPVNHGQPKARSLAKGLCRKSKGSTAFFERGGVHARSIIGHLNSEISLFLMEVFLRPNLFSIPR